MRKAVNLTVRIDTELKAAAEAAAEVMDTTLSRVVRQAFRELVHRAEAEGHRAKSRIASLREVAEEVQEMNARMAVRAGEGPIEGRVSEADALRLMTRQQRRAYERDKAKGKD